MRIERVMRAVVAASWLIGGGAGWAADEHKQHGMEGMSHAGAHENSEHAGMPMGATPAAIWKEVEAHHEDLTKTVDAKKLDSVHERAFAVRDAVNALVEKSGDLPPEALAKLKANAKFVADLAERLDQSGDAGDLAAAQANLKKLDDILKSIPALYPAGKLEASAKE